MTDHLSELGKRVESARLHKGWSKERAGREADISAITWKRIEDGLNVHDVKLTAALRVLQLDRNGEALPPASEPNPEADALTALTATVEQLQARLDDLERRRSG